VANVLDQQELPGLLVLVFEWMMLGTQAIACASIPYGAASVSGVDTATAPLPPTSVLAITCLKLPSAAASWQDQLRPTVARTPLRPA
jgi:hypothetical protein